MRCKMSITATPRRQKITAGTKIGVILAVFGTPENEKRMLMWWRYNERHKSMQNKNNTYNYQQLPLVE